MERILEKIDSPRDLKDLPFEELPRLAGEIREFLLDTVYTTGGHLGSNMGVVELTLALHRVFDFSRDRLLFDVSHQCYTHKLLTGRRESFHTLRQKGGISGFTNRFESPYDEFTVGHAGTAISTALGLAEGDLKAGRKRKIVALVGDAALGCGVAFEALNHGGVLGRNVLVILNDNKWSISKTVGALSAYLNHIRTSPLYQGAKKELRRLVSSLPLVGKKVDEAGEQFLKVLKSTIVPGSFFEDLGLGYFGPVDGHDLGVLVNTLERVKDFEGVVLLHVLTEKGRGAEGAEEQDDRFHGVSPRKVETGSSERTVIVPGAPPPAKGKSWTKAFTGTMIDLFQEDERVVAVTAAMPKGTGLDQVARFFPDRVHDTGIAEQHAVAFSSGMAAAGLRPVAAIYSTFLQRAYDMVFQETLLQKLPVVFAMDRAGVVGEDGATHNGLFDIAFLRTLPEIVLLGPRDETEMRMMFRWALEEHHPAAIRYPRGNCPWPERGGARPPIQLGKAELLREGRDAALFAYGSMVYPALDAADLLAEEGIEAEVWNARFAKPLDVEVLEGLAGRFPLLVTVEEHALAGGFGSAVLEALNAQGGRETRVVRLGVRDRFLEHGKRELVLREQGLDPEGIAVSLKAALGRKRRAGTKDPAGRV